MDYQNGKIYKIESMMGDKIYIGSTTKQYLSQRMVQHKSNYKIWKDGKQNKTFSFNIFDEYGLENCEIILIEDYPCESKDQLTAREAHFIKSLDCVNKIVPGRTDKEYREDTKDKISTRMKDYRDKNRDMINEKTELKLTVYSNFNENTELVKIFVIFSDRTLNCNAL